MNAITPQPIRLNVQGSTNVHLSAQSQTVSLSGASEAHIIRGISPTVDLEAVSGGTQMTVTDIDGEHTTTIYNGQDGADGEDGADGQDGADGNGISSVTLNDDYTLTITFTNGDSVTTDSIRGAQGEPGQDGADGSDGNPGVDGTSAYVHIKYAAAQPTQDSDMKDTADAWMGVYGGTSSTAPTAYTSYTWYNIKGTAGSNGTNGTNGTNGANAYVHIKYAAAQPTQDSDMKDSADAWMGIYSGSSSSAPTAYTSYTWYNIKGTAGANGTNGTNGTNGQDGHSPVVTASKSGTVTTVSVDGEAIATINDGADGAPGAVQSIQMNGSTVADVDGVVDLGTVITAHQDISGKADKDTVGIVEDGDTATHNISAGQYVIWKGSLYIASSSIASGAALSSSNLTAKTEGLGGEVASLAGNVITKDTVHKLTGNSTYLTSYEIEYTVLNRVCVFICKFVPNTNISSSIGDVFVDLPNPFNDTFYMYFPVGKVTSSWNMSDSDGKLATIRNTVNYSPVMRICGAYTSGTAYSFCGSYITD